MRKRFESLWAIRPEAALTVVRLMARDNTGASIGSPSGKVELAGTEWVASAPSMQRGPGSSRIGVIPIQGVLTNDGPAHYGTNYRTIADAAAKYAADPDVSRIILHVDSPGGEVTGLPETAAVIAAAAKIKPVSAIVEGAAASAAYWLTSQASDITVTPSGEVGSVGVRMMHVDISGMLANEGYKVTEMSSGDFKTEWSPYQALSDGAKADMQTRLDASHAEFLGAIASGRGSRATAAIKRGRFGEGRMFTAAAAVKNGMADRVQATRDAYQSLMRPAVDPMIRRAHARIALERQKL